MSTFEVACSTCVESQQRECNRNFKETRVVIDQATEQTMDGGWKVLTLSEDGNVVLTSADPYSGTVLSANAILRGMFVSSLMNRQIELGCNLNQTEVEEKLMGK